MSELCAEAKRDLRRLIGAREGIEAFQPRNRYQGQLRALLLTMVDYMEREHCRPARPWCPEDREEFERWWEILRRYRKVLFSPAMARKGAFRVLTKLLG